MSYSKNQSKYINDDLQTAADTHNFLLQVIQVHRQTQDLARKIKENNLSLIIYIYYRGGFRINVLKLVQKYYEILYKKGFFFLINDFSSKICLFCNIVVSAISRVCQQSILHLGRVICWDLRAYTFC